MIGALIGIGIIAIGWSSVPKKMNMLGSGALLILGAMVTAFGGNPIRDMGMRRMLGTSRTGARRSLALQDPWSERRTA